MFGFLKKKLNDVVKKFSKSVEEDSEVVEKVEREVVVPVESGVKSKDKKKRGEDNQDADNQDKEQELILKEENQIVDEDKKFVDDDVDEVVDEDSDDEDSDDEDSDDVDVDVDDDEVDDEDSDDVDVDDDVDDEDSDDVDDDVDVDEVVDEDSDDVDEDVDEDSVDEDVDKVVDDDVDDDVDEVDEVVDEVDEVDDEVVDEDVDEVVDDKDEEILEPKKKGFFTRLTETFTKIKLSDEKFEDLFWDLEIALLENNVAIDVIDKIKEDLKEELTQDKVSRKNVSQIILETLKKSLSEVLDVEEIDLLAEIKKKKPYVIVVIGVNGSGKTTTIAKLCHYFKKNNKKIVLAAADTFRAAAIQQIEYHAQTLDVKLIKHDYNSDPSAVAFDAVRHAEAKGLDVVVIDTAGRLHSNDNLMNELKKLVRVNNPDLKLFVGESITGKDCVDQAKKYDEVIGIDAIILSKADVDEKGGAALSISYVTKKPVLFLGVGQEYDDLEKYDKVKILKNLGV